MSNIPEMPADLREHLLGFEGACIAGTLSNLYRPSREGGIKIVNQKAALADLFDTDDITGKDTSFIGLFRQLHLMQAISPETLFLPTVRTAVPCADAIRGFVETLYDFTPNINYIHAKRHPLDSDEEVRRLKTLLPKYERVVIVDEDVFNGRTLRNASGIVLRAFNEGTKSTPQELLLVPGHWYSELDSKELREQGIYGGNYIDLDKVSLPILAPIMRRAGEAAARVIDCEDAEEASSIFHRLVFHPTED